MAEDSLIPPTQWSQRMETVRVVVDIQDSADVAVDIEAKRVKFSGTADGKHYAFDIPLHAEVDTEKSKHAVEPRHVLILLVKKEAEWWDRLGENKLRWVKVDWSSWKDEDELDSDDDLAGGFPGGMGGMPGMGGMSGMPGGLDFGDMNFGDFGGGGDDFNDEDGDDLPDLEDDEELPPLEDDDEAAE